MVLQQLDLSLGEAEALITKAARGAGYPWGLATEIGSAARGLMAGGKDGAAEAFADFLEAAANEMPSANHCPVRCGLLRADGVAGDVPETEWPLIEAAFTGASVSGSRAHLAPETYARLDALAALTYAPATEESRARGAG